MSNAPNPQTGPYNNASDIWSKANAAWPAGGLGSDKNKFIGKMSKVDMQNVKKQHVIAKIKIKTL